MFCPECLSEFSPANDRQSYCSPQCKTRARQRRKNAARARRDSELRGQARALIGAAGCQECGTPFDPVNTLQRFCSTTCRYRNRDQRPECRARDNARHRDRVAAGLAPLTGFRNARATAAWYGVEYEEFTPDDIYERDGWRCGICSGEIDRTLEYPDLMSATIDHVIPWSRGGAHTRANCQASHWLCNIRKGAATPALAHA